MQELVQLADELAEFMNTSQIVNFIECNELELALLESLSAINKRRIPISNTSYNKILWFIDNYGISEDFVSHDDLLHLLQGLDDLIRKS